MFDRKNFKGLIALLLLALAAVRSADAATIVLEQSGLIGGTQTVVAPMIIPGAGTLQVTLTDLQWPERLTTLSFALSDATTVLGRMAAPGMQNFTVGGAANLFAHVYGTAAGPLDLGLYSLRVQFTPVPLPSAAVLLLAAVGLFGAMRNPLARQLSLPPV